jgi:hypothetical protein
MWFVWLTLALALLLNVASMPEVVWSWGVRFGWRFLTY